MENPDSIAGVVGKRRVRVGQPANEDVVKTRPCLWTGRRSVDLEFNTGVGCVRGIDAHASETRKAIQLPAQRRLVRREVGHRDEEAAYQVLKCEVDFIWAAKWDEIEGIAASRRALSGCAAAVGAESAGDRRRLDGDGPQRHQHRGEHRRLKEFPDSRRLQDFVHVGCRCRIDPECPHEVSHLQSQRFVGRLER